MENNPPVDLLITMLEMLSAEDKLKLSQFLLEGYYDGTGDCTIPNGNLGRLKCLP